MVKLHLFAGNELLQYARVSAVPRVGDEVRLGGAGSERYYKVKRVVWCLDERTTSAYGDDRANVELEPAP